MTSLHTVAETPIGRNTRCWWSVPAETLAAEPFDGQAASRSSIAWMASRRTTLLHRTRTMPALV
jgi:hypothetical protein